MLTAGIIAEYNPFHNGHAFLARRAREEGATHIAAVMSGNFVQRGEPALLDKFARARQALSCGIDLVLELPLPWAVSGAETFARGGVAALDALGCVDLLCFGSECGSAQALQNAARFALSPALGDAMKSDLSQGKSFAAARCAAAQRELGPEAAAVLRRPNDILGVEYCKAVLSLHSSLRPLALKRHGPGHDEMGAQNEFASAGAIRSLLCRGEPAKPYLPSKSYKILEEELLLGRAPARLKNAERAVLYRLRQMTAQELAQLPDISEGLENRLYRATRGACSLEELYSLVKSKRYSHARIRRLVLAAFLGLKKQDCAGIPLYLRVLGMTPAGAEILHASKLYTKVPLLTNSSDILHLDSIRKNMITLESDRSDLYALCLPNTGPSGRDRTAGLSFVRPGQ